MSFNEMFYDKWKEMRKCADSLKPKHSWGELYAQWYQEQGLEFPNSFGLNSIKLLIKETHEKLEDAILGGIQL